MNTKQMKRLKPTNRALKEWAREMARLPIGNNDLALACRTWLQRKWMTT